MQVYYNTGILLACNINKYRRICTRSQHPAEAYMDNTIQYLKASSQISHMDVCVELRRDPEERLSTELSADGETADSLTELFAIHIGTSVHRK